jgi:acetyl-CoA synthetase
MNAWQSISDILENLGRGDSADHIALRWCGKTEPPLSLTYRELDRQSGRFVGVLHALSSKKGDVVATILDRVPELYTAAVGIFRAGCVFCPLFPAYGPEPVFQRLQAGSARVLLTSVRYFQQKVIPVLDKLTALEHVILADADTHGKHGIWSLRRLLDQAPDRCFIPEILPEDPMLLHFTSGTTGMPKGAVHVHQGTRYQALTGESILGLGPKTVYWCTADPGWITGTVYGIITPLLLGAVTVIDPEEFDAFRWYSTLERENVEVWYTSPSAIRRLMRADVRPREAFDLGGLKRIYAVGEPLSADMVTWGRELLGIPVFDTWWQTETGGIMIANRPGLPLKPGAMGKPVPGIRIAVANRDETQDMVIREAPGASGELAIQAGWPSMFRGYLNNPEGYSACFHDNWYLTGDLVRQDEEGYVWFVGRADDMIKTAGHWVSPFEVESVLMKHPAVLEVAVVGLEDSVFFKTVTAFVCLAPGYDDTEDLNRELTGFARKHLGPAVAPRKIIFSGPLPKNNAGKIVRRILTAGKSRERPSGR